MVVAGIYGRWRGPVWAVRGQHAHEGAQPQTAEAVHGPAGEAPRSTGFGARLPCTGPPPAGEHRGTSAEVWPATLHPHPRHMGSQRPQPRGRVPRAPHPGGAPPPKAQGGPFTGPPSPAETSAHTGTQTQGSRGIPGWTGGGRGWAAASWRGFGGSGVRGLQRRGQSGVRGQGGSLGRAGLPGAYPLVFLGRAQEFTVSVVHGPVVPLHAIHSLLLYA